MYIYAYAYAYACTLTHVLQGALAVRPRTQHDIRVAALVQHLSQKRIVLPKQKLLDDRVLAWHLHLQHGKVQALRECTRMDVHMAHGVHARGSPDACGPHQHAIHG